MGKIPVFLYLIALLSTALLPLHSSAQLTIQERNTLDYGDLLLPITGSQWMQFEVTNDNFTAASTGTSIGGRPGRGRYRLKRGKRADSATITIDVGYNNSISGITLSDAQGLYGGIVISAFPAGGLPEPGRGNGTDLYLSPRATYSNLVIEGQYTPNFDIIVLFE